MRKIVCRSRAGGQALVKVINESAWIPETNNYRISAPGEDYQLPAELRYQWGLYCGIPGGIPDRTTIYTSLGVPGQAPSYAQSVTADQIRAAIAACPSGQVVYLYPGTYNIGEVTFAAKSGVTLRGAGPGQTNINTTGTYAFSSNGYSFYTADRIALVNDSGLLKGAMYITLASAPTADFKVGNLIMVNQDDDHNLWGTDIGPYHRVGYTEP